MTAKPEALDELELKPLLLELLGKALPPLGQLKLFTWVQDEVMFIIFTSHKSHQ